MEDVKIKFEFTQGDRLRRSMKVAKMSVQGMADFLGVTRETVSTWINDRHKPNRQTLMLWSARTGVPLVWLQTGAWDDTPEPCAGGVAAVWDENEYNPASH